VREEQKEEIKEELKDTGRFGKDDFGLLDGQQEQSLVQDTTEGEGKKLLIATPDRAEDKGPKTPLASGLDASDIDIALEQQRSL